MVEVHLDGNEREVLRRLLEGVVSDLGFEIANTDRLSLRQALKADKQVALKVLIALEHPAAA
ncbi:MAG: hypothetical protein OEM67_12930 [Thermoleophilia bacterium]|nr:hypothetical protein [Thermoleophilia bacterium]